MPSIRQDLDYLQTAAESFQRFLLSGEIYGPAASRHATDMGAADRLTLGGTLLARRRVSGRDLTAAQQKELSGVDQLLEEARDHWHSHWEMKAVKEFPARLTLWGNYLFDLSQDPGSARNEYAYQVRRRAILELLRVEAAIPAELLNRLEDQDLRLRERFSPGGYTWEAELARVFPTDPFWFLYGFPRSNR